MGHWGIGPFDNDQAGDWLTAFQSLTTADARALKLRETLEQFTRQSQCDHPWQIDEVRAAFQVLLMLCDRETPQMAAEMRQQRELGYGLKKRAIEALRKACDVPQLVRFAAACLPTVVEAAKEPGWYNLRFAMVDECSMILRLDEAMRAARSEERTAQETTTDA